MASSAALARLGERMRESKARFEVARPLLPAGLAPHVEAGPYNDDGWSLVASNAAVAAKLRHLLPRIAEAVAQAGLQTAAIRVKVRKTA